MARTEQPYFKVTMREDGSGIHLGCYNFVLCSFEHSERPTFDPAVFTRGRDGVECSDAKVEERLSTIATELFAFPHVNKVSIWTGAILIEYHDPIPVPSGELHKHGPTVRTLGYLRRACGHGDRLLPVYMPNDMLLNGK